MFGPDRRDVFTWSRVNARRADNLEQQRATRNSQLATRFPINSSILNATTNFLTFAYLRPWGLVCQATSDMATTRLITSGTYVNVEPLNFFLVVSIRDSRLTDPTPIFSITIHGSICRPVRNNRWSFGVHKQYFEQIFSSINSHGK